MKSLLSFVYILFTISFFFDTVHAQTKIKSIEDLATALEQFSEIEIQNIELELRVKQPLNHDDPSAGYFYQRVFLLHKDFNKPMVMELEGYAARPHVVDELTKLLDANQIIIEHRYFGKSLPDSLDYQYLNIRQASQDHHHIYQLFKNMYPGKWVATGISKGGQTSMYYKRFYPDDVDAVVCYVAPLNLSDVEPRVYSFLDRVGTRDCRDRIYSFQKLLLKRETDFLPLFKKYADKKQYTFYRLGMEKTFEYCVLEYPFAFWQWQSESCGDIPDSTTSSYQIFDHFITVASPTYFSDSGIAQYEPFFHQALNEIGYYGYDLKPFAGMLNYVTDGTYKFNAPEGTEPQFNPAVMEDIYHWIQKSGQNLIFIYGEYDPWSASAVKLNGDSNSLVMIKSQGSHGTRIRHFSQEERNKIYEKLEEWLDIKINR